MVAEEVICRLVLCGHLHYFCFSKLSLLCVFRLQLLCKMRSLLFWDLRQHLLFVSYGCFRMACRSHLQGSMSQKCEDLIFVLLPLYLHSLFHVIFFPVSFEVCLVVSFSVTWMLPLFITAKPFCLKH